MEEKFRIDTLEKEKAAVSFKGLPQKYDRKTKKFLEQKGVIE